MLGLVVSNKGLNGPALAMMGVGAAFIYSGIKGDSILKTAQLIISGKSPTGQSPSAVIGTPTTGLASSVAGSTVGATGNPTAGAWTHDGLMKLWQSAGGSAATANNAACHALQESSGDASITSPNPDGGTNVGLWQLDTKGVGAGHTVSQLQNPATNAMITVRGTRNGTDWSEWATPGC
jgi:hypothetical protein